MEEGDNKKKEEADESIPASENYDDNTKNPEDSEEKKDIDGTANIFSDVEKPAEPIPELFMPEVTDDEDEELTTTKEDEHQDEKAEKEEPGATENEEEKELVEEKTTEDVVEEAKKIEDVQPKMEQDKEEESPHDAQEAEEQSSSLKEKTESSPTALSGDSMPDKRESVEPQDTVESLTNKMVNLEVYETKDRVSESIGGLTPKVGRKSKISRPSIKSKRSTIKKSIYYDFKPRFDEDFQMRSSGDFGIMDDTDGPTRFYGYMGYGEEEEEAVVEESVEEEEIERIDREPYYKKYDILKEEIAEVRVKNYILQKKLSIVFKKRKMDHVLRESDFQYDTQMKYAKKLDMYGELIEDDKVKREEITKELDLLKKKRETKYLELSKLFQQMQDREKEIGYGLINTKTGNPIPDKLVEKLIRRQQVQTEQVSAMRLAYIKLKDMVAEKQDAITALDQIGDGLHLMDYEQLKVENRSHADKIEERDEELTRLRAKCQNTIQVLAHIREKSAALENDIDDLNDDVSLIKMQYTQIREQLNGAKQERDHYRMKINKLRSDSGLLTEPKLLRDMEYSMEELKHTSQELDQLKEENKIKTIQIRNIRKNIDFATSSDMIFKKSKLNLSEKSSSKVTKSRKPTFSPIIPEMAFEYLKDFAPKVRVIRRRK